MEHRDVGDGNVVSLFGTAAAPGYPAIAQVDAYWEGLRRGRLMPDRAEVDPRGLEGALEFAFVMERVAPGIGRVRISGMHLGNLLGMDVRGMPLSAFFVPDARDRIQRVLESVMTGPQVADVTLTGERGIGRPALSARLLLAPLSNTQAPDAAGPNPARKNAPRVLACLESHGQIGRAPRRFDIEQVQMRRIVETAGAPVCRPHIRAAQTQGNSAPDRDFAPAGSRTRPHLRLVTSGE